jgi:hypothetical protein
MEEIIPPVPKKIVERELTRDKFVRYTNNANNELYIITYHDSPNVMREIGRLREISFRQGGGGTGLSLDIDEFDSNEDCYKQLLVWDPKHREILGGYRFYIPTEEERLNKTDYTHKLSTSHFFQFSDTFKQEYLPYMIELGRSFVQPAYQSTNRARKSLYALDNLWDGLGALLVDNPDMKYFFGKITMYPTFNITARNYILFFLGKHFGDKENLVTPIKSLQLGIDVNEFHNLFSGSNYNEDYKILSKKVREQGENIPPLFNAYMNLSPTMKTFGTMINDEFGNVEETGMMITINDLYISKVERHVTTYQRLRYYLKTKSFDINKFSVPKFRILEK